jgi:predicted DNA-binding transcriptional regulator YafY
LVGHSSDDGEVRVFPVRSIERIELTDQPYSIPPRFRLERYLERSRESGQPPTHATRLRFGPKVARAVRDALPPSEQRLSPGPGGAIDLWVDAVGLDEVISWLIGFGDEVEVLEPPELRRAVKDWAERIAHTHSRRTD